MMSYINFTECHIFGASINKLITSDRFNPTPDGFNNLSCWYSSYMIKRPIWVMQFNWTLQWLYWLFKKLSTFIKRNYKDISKLNITNDLHYVYGSAFIVQYKLQHLFSNLFFKNCVRLAVPFFLFWGPCFINSLLFMISRKRWGICWRWSSDAGSAWFFDFFALIKDKKLFV